MKTRIGHLNYINNKNRKSSESESYNFVWVKSDVTGEVFPIMLSHSFNKEGKITDEQAYFSTNHFE